MPQAARDVRKPAHHEAKHARDARGPPCHETEFPQSWRAQSLTLGARRERCARPKGKPGARGSRLSAVATAWMAGPRWKLPSTEATKRFPPALRISEMFWDCAARDGGATNGRRRGIRGRFLPGRGAGFDADEGAAGGEEAPREMGGFADADAEVGDDADGLRGLKEADAPGGGAEIAAVVAAVHPQRGGEFAGSGTQGADWVEFGRGIRETAAGHEMEPARGFDGGDEDEAVFRSAFDQDVEHPVHAVIKIDVGGARPVFGNEGPGGWPREGVAGFVIHRAIGFGLDDDAGAMFPGKRAADQLAGACDGVALEEIAGDFGGGNWVLHGE